MQTRKRVQGFTLLEVMVVLAIIGSIMALVATNIIGSATDARLKPPRAR
jgi:general secretion pathway protein G